MIGLWAITTFIVLTIAHLFAKQEDKLIAMHTKKANYNLARELFWTVTIEFGFTTISIAAVWWTAWHFLSKWNIVTWNISFSSFMRGALFIVLLGNIILIGFEINVIRKTKEIIKLEQ